MSKLTFFGRLFIICFALILFYLYTSRQERLNSVMKTSTTEKSNTLLSQTKIYGKENSPNRILFSTNERKTGQNFTEGLSETRLSSESKPHEKTNFSGNTNNTTSSGWCDSCINYHQYKAVIYPKHIPDTYLDMVIFIPSQHRDSSYEKRQFLRKFPLNSTNFPQLKIRHIFVFGKFSLFTARNEILHVSVILFIRGFSVRQTPLDRDHPEQRQPWTETAWTETPLDRDPHWTETTQTETPRQRSSRQRPPGQRPL